MMTDKPQSITFHIIGSRSSVPSTAHKWSAYLKRDQWDDWGKFCTQFYLTVVDGHGEHQEIGHLKIGQSGLKPHKISAELPPGNRKPDIQSPFERLNDNFFSVGQDEEYYANLSSLGDNVREEILNSLRDVAWDKDRWEWAKDEEVMGESLLRSVTRSTVSGQFRRMAHGDARVTPYDFTYSPPKRLGGDGAPPYALDFRVNPTSPIPTNLHVLIGRNGVGKTRILSLMAKALVAKDASARQSGKFEFSEDRGNGGTFANVVAVSFSAFDDGDLLAERNPGSDSLGFSYIGLRTSNTDSLTSLNTKSPSMLAREFVESLSQCRIGGRRKRWETVISILQSDPVFRAAQLSNMIEQDLSNKEEKEEVLKTFKALSSGHKIVLLTLTRLVEKVEERTLVLIDEPEAHLHPPLLSAMTRAISELMVKRNGVAIVATHSPVILQEVPKSCVWILDRMLTASKAERPSIETFAESVGILSREVFQLELSQSGYHQILRELRRRSVTYEDALDELNRQLGAEGKAVLRGIYLNDEE